MIPGTRDIEHYRGTTYLGETLQPFTAGANPGDADVPVTLEAASGKMQVRKGKTGPVVIEWTTEDETMELTSEYIIIHSRTGVEMNIPAGTYEYDIVLVMNNGDTLPYVRGKFSIIERVSR